MSFLKSWRARLVLVFAVIGPGFITANVDNDAGGIFTYSQAGAQFGYSLLWTMIPITIALVVVQEMASRMGAVTGKGRRDLIREGFGFRVTFRLSRALAVPPFGTLCAESAGAARTWAPAALLPPCEGTLLRAHGIDAVFVGHPLLDRALTLPNRADARRSIGIGPEERLLVLFPGSRAQEIARHLDLFVATAVELQRRDPSLKVVVSAARASDGRARLAVTDGCGGIEDDDLARVFEIGWRGEPERGTSDAGAGLGLAIARGVIESHAGSISVANVDGGCRFDVELPTHPVA